MRIRVGLSWMFFLLMGFNQIGFSQELEVEFETDLPKNSSNLYWGLTNEDETILLLNVSNYHELAKKSRYFILDLTTLEMMCNFNTDRWTYQHDAYFYKDKYLYLSFGIRLRTKYYIFDISQGDIIGKVLGKDSPKGDSYSSKNNSCYAKQGDFDRYITVGNYIFSFNNETSKIQIFSK